MTTAPYLSVVGFARNDSYTAGYHQRLERSLGFLARQLERHAVPAEIVIVEWNPPSDRPLLADDLKVPSDLAHVTIRFVIVDGKYHRQSAGWQSRGMHGSNAANVGLRRARGTFVLHKLMDTYLSEPIVALIAKRELREDAQYRCDRLEVKIEGDDWLALPDERILEELSKHAVARNTRLTHSADWKIRDLHTNASGDFMLMAATKWNLIRGFPADPTVLCLDADSIAMHAAAAHGAEEICLPDGFHVYKLVHGNTYVIRTRTVWRDWQLRLDRYLVTIKKRELAAKLRQWLDYPRRRVLGAEEILAPSIERLFVARAERFARNDTSLKTNTADWGMAGVTLPEKVVTRAKWDMP